MLESRASWILRSACASLVRDVLLLSMPLLLAATSNCESLRGSRTSNRHLKKCTTPLSRGEGLPASRERLKYPLTTLINVQITFGSTRTNTISSGSCRCCSRIFSTLFCSSLNFVVINSSSFCHFSTAQHIHFRTTKTTQPTTMPPK